MEENEGRIKERKGGMGERERRGGRGRRVEWERRGGMG